ncbi:MAG: hypothetical protein FJX42_03535 [Alphaproteobacteria bacterium]|nr:hypothetical protein [Alphaproteobacteria bacterium]
MATKRRPSSKKPHPAKKWRPGDMGAAAPEKRTRHIPPEIIALMKTKSLVPFCQESFYEGAWHARHAIAKKAIAEAQKNLSRALSLFEHYDKLIQMEASPVPLFKENATSKTLAAIFISKKMLMSNMPPNPPRPPEQILTSSQPTLMNGTFTPFFTAENQHDLVIEWLREISLQDYDAIAELGSGYGRNLFKLYCNGGPAGIPYYAGEYTQSGLALTKLFAALDRHVPIKPVFFDHNAPDLSFLKGAKRVLLFSCHSIEQVYDIPLDYFEKLAQAAPVVTGVHFEPFGFQFGGTDPISLNHRAIMANKQWNHNMLECLKKAADRGFLSIRHMAANVISPQGGNPTSVAIWDNAPLRGRN